MLDQRLRYATESIGGDMSLTDYLDDAEAARLISWGVQVAQELVLRTIEMDDGTAQNYLDDHIQNLRRVIRRLNRLLPETQYMETEEIQEKLSKIFEAAESISSLQFDSPTDLRMVAQDIKIRPAPENVSLFLAMMNADKADDETL